MTGYTPLRAPFPYYGGKRRWAPAVNHAIGPGVHTYIEPFFGSGALLLSRPPARREIVCDTNACLVNFWRSVRAEPVETAVHADAPTYHEELLARRHYLAQWQEQHAERASRDPLFHDPRAAGYWAYCVSNWIGGIDRLLQTKEHDPIPHSHLRGSAVNREPSLDVRPHVPRPTGVSAPPLPDAPPLYALAPRPALVAWLIALANRFQGVYAMNRSFESALTNAITGESAHNGIIAVVLDPPYRFDGANKRYSLYPGDAEANDVAVSSYRRAVELGAHPRYRVVYFCHEGDFPLPPGWRQETLSFSGPNSPGKNELRDQVLISPHCRPPQQPALL